MNQGIITKKCFEGLAFVMFDRTRALWFCLAYVSASFAAERFCHWAGIFSCSGAIVTIAGLFLNIKYSLNFHLKISKVSLYNKLAGAGVFGTSTITKEQEAYVDNVLADELYGVSFMVAGTLLWAYGSYLVAALK